MAGDVMDALMEGPVVSDPGLDDLDALQRSPRGVVGSRVAARDDAEGRRPGELRGA